MENTCGIEFNNINFEFGNVSLNSYEAKKIAMFIKLIKVFCKNTFLDFEKIVFLYVIHLNTVFIFLMCI